MDIRGSDKEKEVDVMKWTDVYINWADYSVVEVDAWLYYKGESFLIERVRGYEDAEGDVVVPLDEKLRVSGLLKEMYALRFNVVDSVTR